MRTLLLALVFIVSGCAAIWPTNARKINNVSLGMTKTEVIQVMGAPDSTSAKEGIEYLNYILLESPDGIIGYHQAYFVRIIGGKVEAYGRSGDFDSTKAPENKLTIDLNTNK